jgi:cytochrome b subunit of formate dehydrogenase
MPRGDQQRGRRSASNSGPRTGIAAVAILLATLVATGVVIWGGSAESGWGALRIALIGYSASIVVLTGVLALRVVEGQGLALALLVTGQAFWFALPIVSELGSGTWFGDRIGYRLRDEHVWLALGYCVLFFVISAGSYLAMNAYWRRREVTGWLSRIARSEHVSAGWVLALTGFGILPFLVYGESVEAVVQGILASRATIKPWTQVALTSKPLYVVGRAALVTVGEIALFNAIGFGNRPGRRRWAWWGLFAVAFLITYFDSGTRSWTAVVVAPPALVALRRAIASGRGRRWLLIGPALLMLVIWVTQVQLAFRLEGANREALQESPLGLWDNDFFTETAIATSVVPERYDYLQESVVWLFAVNPIPRAWWEGKPYPRVFQIYGIGRRGYDEYSELGTSSMPSLLGQYHMSWGWFGVVEISMFYGLAFALLDRMWRRGGSGYAGDLWASTVALWLLLGFRALLPGFHYPILLLGLALLSRRAGRARGVLSPQAG